MAGRIARGWELFKESWAVLRQDKELILFPIFSSIACILVVISFAMPFLFVPGLLKSFAEEKGHPESATHQVISYAMRFAFYFVNYFVVVFFNVGLVSCAMIRFKGGNPTFGDGMQAAFARLPQIIAWAFLAATVGMILRTLEERFKGLGRFVVGLIGLAWSIATYFVVPVLAAEGVGPIDAVKRSAGVLRKTWGESLVGNISMGLAGFLLSLPGIALLFGGIAAGVALNSIVAGVLISALGLIYLLLLSVVMSAMQQIFLAGTYLYATEGVVAPGFTEDLFRDAFRHK